MDVKTQLDELTKDVEQGLKIKPRKGIAKGTRLPPAPKMESGLTPQQEAYCRARSLGMDKRESLQLIGLDSPHYATRWEKVPEVQKRIQELCELVTQNSILKAGLDRGWVITRLMTVTERCMQAEPVKDRDGNPTGEFRFDSAGANRALELLGKTMRMFEAKDPVKNDEYANLTDDEIARIAAELAAQTGLAGYIAGAEEKARSQQVIEVQAVPKAD